MMKYTLVEALLRVFLDEKSTLIWRPLVDVNLNMKVAI